MAENMMMDTGSDDEDDNKNDNDQTGETSIVNIIETFLKKGNVPEEERGPLTTHLVKGYETHKHKVDADGFFWVIGGLLVSLSCDMELTAKFDVKELANLLFPKIPPVQPRMVSVAYEIEDTTISHQFDVNKFSENVIEVSNLYYGPEGQNYIAPYFCLIQSSGMGKTKILYEYRNMCKSKANVTCKLVLSGLPTENEGTKELFDEILYLKDVITGKASAGEACRAIFDKLDELFLKEVLLKLSGRNMDESPHLVVLLFDEAQFFLKEKLYKYEVFFFRVVRLWLRVSRPDNLRVVAVFTGTNAKLRNFEFANDHQLASIDTASREMQPKSITFREKGQKSFSHFMHTTTIGCQRQLAESARDQSEYEKAIFCGRPLFATMQEKGDLTDDKLYAILGRMLLVEADENDPNDWDRNEIAWLNILGTRVQMGQTSVPVASDLVARGYANLTACTDRTATICYLPDPVCARLAMCLMKEDVASNDAGFPTNGKPPSWWVARMRDLFAGGLCQPEKGDFGEIMVAFYMLLCGDMLRFDKDPTLKTFSVDLFDWLQLMCQGVKEPEPRNSSYPKRKKTATGFTYQTAEIGFIQVCRNYLRHYEEDWSDFFRRDFLQFMYDSGTAFFVFASCSVIDMVIAIRLTSHSGVISYVPLVISIKSRAYFSASAASDECNRMTLKCNGRTAMCLLIVFGSETSSQDLGFQLEPSRDVGSLLSSEVVAKTLRIPFHDGFGLTTAFQDITKQAEMGEVFASHHFLHTGDKTINTEKALRSSSKASDKGSPAEMLSSLKSDFNRLMSQNNTNI